MYFIGDKKSAIKEVQRYLTYIAEYYEKMPYTQIDGIYSEETKAAVEFFQKEKKIEITGYVNDETFQLIASEYNQSQIRKQSEKDTFNDITYPLKRGDANESVVILNSLIRQLSKYYDIPSVPFFDVYNDDTANSVKLMQKIFGFAENGVADIKLLTRMMIELKTRKNFSKEYKST